MIDGLFLVPAEKHLMPSFDRQNKHSFLWHKTWVKRHEILAQRELYPLGVTMGEKMHDHDTFQIGYALE